MEMDPFARANLHPAIPYRHVFFYWLGHKCDRIPHPGFARERMDTTPGKQLGGFSLCPGWHDALVTSIVILLLAVQICLAHHWFAHLYLSE